MVSELSIRTDGNRDAWKDVDGQVEKFSAEQGWTPDLDFQLRLVLEELVLNATTHGSRHSDDAYVEVKLTSAEDTVSIELIDNGPAFNPLDDAPVPDTEATVEERRVGGLGVHLVRNIVDSITYERVGEENRLSMVKSR